MCRLSFIVPFYNVEPYIEECIRSLYNQDMPQDEYEVICVDDCSPDGSRGIVERLQKEYPTLRLLTHKENKRQGGARNTGLREAKGRYIWFVDSDDYIKPNCLKGLLDTAENDDLDILKFYYKYDSAELDNIKKVSTSIVTGTELIFEINTGEAPMEKCSTVWCQLIKRDLIESHKIIFAEKVQYEDDDFMYQSYAVAKRVMLIGDVMYYIRETPNSTTRRKNDLRRARDMYAQAIRYTVLAPKLASIDNRWANLSVQYIRETIVNQVFRVLKDCSVSEQIIFWMETKRDVKKLKPFLTPNAYAKLCSYLLWKLM